MGRSRQEPKEDIQVAEELFPECYALVFADEVTCKMVLTGQYCKYAEQCAKECEAEEMTYIPDSEYKSADIRLVPRSETWREKTNRGEM